MKRFLTRDIKVQGFWEFLASASIILAVLDIAIGLNPGVSPLIPSVFALATAAFLIWLGRAMRDQSAKEADSKRPESPNPEEK